uniref:Erythromycin biosynthesis protein CIII-like C-terminal domain-containing protein n=1 Tax=Alexandrium catenella TaxID=2925 RepID=A0A7S1LYW2_ALECA
MRVAIMCHGTRGHVQPLVLLGRQLQQAGHTVRAFVPFNLLELSYQWGVEAWATEVDLEEVLPKVVDQETQYEESSLWKFRHGEVFVDPLAALWEFKPECVVWGYDGTAALQYQHLRNVPAVMVHCSYYQPGGSIDKHFNVPVSSPFSCPIVAPIFLASSPLLGGRQALEVRQAGCKEHNGTYLRLDDTTFVHESESGSQCWRSEERGWLIGNPAESGGRATYVAGGIGPLPPEEGWAVGDDERGRADSVPVVTCVGVRAAPSSLPPHVHQTGAWLPSDDHRPAELQAAELPAELSQELFAFIVAGPAPVAIGWGSVTRSATVKPEPLKVLLLALRALRLQGRRAVVLGGYAKLQDVFKTKSRRSEPKFPDEEELKEFARANCFFTKAVPHQWLLPCCSCHVHHGGAGTLHASLHAGKPSVIVPFTNDQFQWADVVGVLGIGVGFKHASKVTPTRFAEAIAQAELMTPAAEKLGERMRAEGGNSAAKAAEVLHSFMQREVRGWALACRPEPQGRACSALIERCLIL